MLLALLCRLAIVHDRDDRVVRELGCHAACLDRRSIIARRNDEADARLGISTDVLQDEPRGAVTHLANHAVALVVAPANTPVAIAVAIAIERGHRGRVERSRGYVDDRKRRDPRQPADDRTRGAASTYE